MTQDHIYEQLGLSSASDEAKQNIIENIVATTELRFADIIDDVLSEEQAEEFSRVVDGGNVENNVNWLRENVAEAAQLYEAVLTDVVDDIKTQLDR